MSWLSKKTGIHVKIGGTVGKIANNIGNEYVRGVKNVGHAVGSVASNPWVQAATTAALAATGVGAPAAAAIMAAERGGGALLKKGGNIGQGIRGGVEGAVAGYGASKLGGLARTGLSALANRSSTAGGTVDVNSMYTPGGADAVTSGGSSWGAKLKGLFLGGGADGKGNFGALGDIAGKVGGALSTASGNGVLDKALLAAGIFEAAKESQEKKKLMNQGLGYVTDAYSAKQPLRHRGLELMQDETAPDLSGIFQNRANPYTRARVPYQVSAIAPAAPVTPANGSTY